MTPPFLPYDLAVCKRLLLAAIKQSVQLEHQVATRSDKPRRRSSRRRNLIACSTRRLPRIKSYNNRTPPHSTNWPGTDAGLLADDESVFPKTNGKDTGKPPSSTIIRPNLPPSIETALPR